MREDVRMQLVQGTPTSVSVIIPSWNTRQLLRNCIDSVKGEADVAVELLVVDNGSTDGSREFLAQAGIAHVDFPQNEGFAKAVNTGVARTRAPLLLVLNADVVLEPGCLAALVRALGADPTLAGVQPKIIAKTSGQAPRLLYSMGQGLTTACSAYEIGRGEADGARFAHDCEIFGVCGAICLLRRDAFESLGGYDDRYFAFYEDVDLNARARLSGWRFAYVSGACAVHIGHASWGQQRRARDFNVRLTVQNRIWTAVRVLPAYCLPWVALATVRTLAASPFKRVGKAAMTGVVRSVPRLPRLARERRRLRANGAAGLDAWITPRPVDPIGPRN